MRAYACADWLSKAMKCKRTAFGSEHDDDRIPRECNQDICEAEGRENKSERKRHRRDGEMRSRWHPLETAARAATVPLHFRDGASLISLAENPS